MVFGLVFFKVRTHDGDDVAKRASHPDGAASCSGSGWGSGSGSGWGISSGSIQAKMSAAPSTTALPAKKTSPSYGEFFKQRQETYAARLAAEDEDTRANEDVSRLKT